MGLATPKGLHKSQLIAIVRLMNKQADIKTSSKAAKPTPMMAQYLEIKHQAGTDVILFYRMGDFYEMFFEDAVNAAAALDIALTKRGKHKGAEIPMCGVPVHAAETYLQRLIKKGFRVAVCEQTEDPKEAKKRGYKAVVRREIVRVVTPGTLTEDSLLDARSSNTILCIAATKAGQYALAWADVSEGLFEVCALDKDRLESEIAALSPREIVVSESLYQDADLKPVFTDLGAAMTPVPNAKFDARAAERRLKTYYGAQSLDGFGAYSKAEISAAGALLDYLELTQAGQKVMLSPPQQKITSGYLSIDPATRASLEIDRTQAGTKAGSLLSVIDKTVTGPGARLLSARLSRPLVDVTAINRRLDAIAYFNDHKDVRAAIRTLLKSASDAARSYSRIALERGGPRDLLAIAHTLLLGEKINALFMKQDQAKLPSALVAVLDGISLADKPELAALVRDLTKAIKADPPMLARDGGFIAPGWASALDELVRLRDDSRKVIAGLQAQYADTTKVNSLKIKHNNVLGYFIEVTPKHGETLLGSPHNQTFIHRQTLVSGIRFTTEELVDLDAKISGAADKAVAIELEIFNTLCMRMRAVGDQVRESAAALAVLDVQCAGAEWVVEVDAVRPAMDTSTVFEIEGGRHPVVESALKKEGSAAFTANDCRLDGSGDNADRLTLITGPNMAGKSTYLRQNALMFILAQAGFYVPARKARIGVADALFSRVGASDDLSRGRSTFMSEMIETAAILNRAGPRTFIILDEIGRGTATFDGLSIAWATAEHLYEINQSRALFATHYHELTNLIETLDKAGNACLHAKEWEGDLVFLHDVKPGAADKSYGVQVAKLAGLPAHAVARARQVLERLEAEADNGSDALGGLPLFSASAPVAVKPEPSKIDKAVTSLDVDSLSPREALDLLYELKAIGERDEH